MDRHTTLMSLVGEVMPGTAPDEVLHALVDTVTELPHPAAARAMHIPFTAQQRRDLVTVAEQLDDVVAAASDVFACYLQLFWLAPAPTETWPRETLTNLWRARVPALVKVELYDTSPGAWLTVARHDLGTRATTADPPPGVVPPESGDFTVL